MRVAAILNASADFGLYIRVAIFGDLLELVNNHQTRTVCILKISEDLI